MRVKIHRFPVSNRCNKNLESIHSVNKQSLHYQSISQSTNQSINQSINQSKGSPIWWLISSSSILVNTSGAIKNT